VERGGWREEGGGRREEGGGRREEGERREGKKEVNWGGMEGRSKEYKDLCNINFHSSFTEITSNGSCGYEPHLE